MIDALKLIAFLVVVLGAIALAVFSEARGEPIAGQIAVASVVLERGRDTCSVVQEPFQFAGVHEWPYPRDPMAIDAEAWGVALGVAHSVLRGTKSPCPGADSFHEISISPYWATGKACVVGRHAFYRNRGASWLIE